MNPLHLTQHSGHRLRLAWLVVAQLVGLFTVLRISLAVFYASPLPVSLIDWVHCFAVGFHFDLAVGVLLATPIALWSTVGSLAPWTTVRSRRILTVGSVLGWTAMVFLLISEAFFFEEFESRFNPVAVDYLIFPHEVFVNVWESYPFLRVLFGCLILGTGAALLSLRVTRSVPTLGRNPFAAAIWALCALGLGLSFRSSEALFSRNRSVNELAGNTFVALGTAILTRNLDYAAFYPTIPLEEAFDLARNRLLSPGQIPSGGPRSLQRHIPGNASRPKLNVILLLEESLGSEFWGSLGRSGASLMPRMDAFATNEALLFDNLYADGNRTIRGYEGVYCSFPPLPGDSIVARDRTLNVETIAQVLGRDGYKTTFIYAGRGSFDGTGTFARKNGWEKFLELKDFSKKIIRLSGVFAMRISTINQSKK